MFTFDALQIAMYQCLEEREGTIDEYEALRDSTVYVTDKEGNTHTIRALEIEDGSLFLLCND